MYLETPHHWKAEASSLLSCSHPPIQHIILVVPTKYQVVDTSVPWCTLFSLPMVPILVLGFPGLISNVTSSEKSSVNSPGGAEHVSFVPPGHLVIHRVTEWTVCLHAAPPPHGMS